jgi:hypothetical protein
LGKMSFRVRNRFHRRLNRDETMVLAPGSIVRFGWLGFGR